MKKIITFTLALAGCVSATNSSETPAEGEGLLWSLNATCNEEHVEATLDGPAAVFIANAHGSEKQFVITNEELGVRLYLNDGDTSAQQAMVFGKQTNVEIAWRNDKPIVTLQGPECFGSLEVIN